MNQSIFAVALFCAVMMMATTSTAIDYEVWDWENDELIHEMFIIGLERPVSTKLPFHDYVGPASDDLFLGGDGASDYYRDEGWVLIKKDFGSPTKPVTLPFFILYNKYRGILRYFFFNTVVSETYSYGLVQMGRQSGNGAAALFTFGDADYTLERFDADSYEDAIIKLAPYQWCYADFAIVGYDDDIPVNAAMTFSISGVDESEVHLDGELSLRQVMAVANVAGRAWNPGDLLSDFKTGYVKYKSAREGLNKLKKSVKENWAKKILLPVLDSPLASAVPYLSAANALVNAFIGGKPKQMTPMKFDGEINLNGKITTTNFLYTMLVRVPGAPLTDPQDPARSEYNLPLGLFNITAPPTIDHDLEMSCRINKTTWYEECFNRVNYSLGQKVKVLVNPYLDAVIKARAGIVFKNQAVEYLSIEEFNDQRWHEEYWDYEDPQYMLDSMALEIVVEPNNCSYEDPITMTNNYKIYQRLVMNEPGSTPSDDPPESASNNLSAALIFAIL